MNKYVTKTIEILFLIVFVFIVLGGLFYKNQQYMPSNQLFVIISAFGWFIIFIFLYKWLCKTEIVNFKNIKGILIIIFVLFFMLQVFVAREIAVYPTWDFGDNYNIARNYVLYGTTDFSHSYSNNYFLIFALIFIYRISYLIGFVNFSVLSILLNIVFIDLSIFIVYLVVKKLCDIRTALFAVLICLFSTPFLFYTPIFYSDTLTLFIPILMFYLVILLNDNNSKKKTFLLIISLSILAFLGYKMKASILVCFVAILIYWFFQNKSFKEKFGDIVLCFLIILVLFLSFNAFEKNFMKNASAVGKNFPKTHWIMMGLNDNTKIYGNYWYQDVNYTENSNHKIEDNIKVIKERIENRKF